jgi:hypothetical protein
VVEEPKRMERKRTRRELKRKKQLKNNGVIWQHVWKGAKGSRGYMELWG